MNIPSLPKRKPSAFDLEVERCISELNSMDSKSAEYEQAVKNLKILCEARAVKDANKPSIDTIWNNMFYIGGLLLMLNHERLNIITTKAIAMVLNRGPRT